MTTAPNEKTAPTLIAKPDTGGWIVVAVEDGRERRLGHSSAIGRRRAIHDVLLERNRRDRQTTSAKRPRRGDDQPRQKTPRPHALTTTDAQDAQDAQDAAWAALKAAVTPQRAPRRPKRPRQTPPKQRADGRPAPASNPTTPAPNAQAKPAMAEPATPPPVPAALPAKRASAVDGVWGVHVTVEQLADGEITTTSSATAAGPISAALSQALRDAVGDRRGGRIRKALRRHGLLRSAVVFEDETTTSANATTRLRIHAAPLAPTLAAAARTAIADATTQQTRDTPPRRDPSLLAA